MATRITTKQYAFDGSIVERTRFRFLPGEYWELRAEVEANREQCSECGKQYSPKLMNHTFYYDGAWDTFGQVDTVCMDCIDKSIVDECFYCEKCDRLIYDRHGIHIVTFDGGDYHCTKCEEEAE